MSSLLSEPEKPRKNTKNNLLGLVIDSLYIISIFYLEMKVSWKTMAENNVRLLFVFAHYNSFNAIHYML